MDSVTDALLDVAPEAGGEIRLLDAVLVDMNNGKHFTMNVDADQGRVILGGANRMRADGGAAVNFLAGRTILNYDYNLVAEAQRDVGAAATPWRSRRRCSCGASASSCVRPTCSICARKPTATTSTWS